MDAARWRRGLSSSDVYQRSRSPACTNLSKKRFSKRPIVCVTY